MPDRDRNRPGCPAGDAVPSFGMLVPLAVRAVRRRRRGEPHGRPGPSPAVVANPRAPPGRGRRHHPGPRPRPRPRHAPDRAAPRRCAPQARPSRRRARPAKPSERGSALARPTGRHQTPEPAGRIRHGPNRRGPSPRSRPRPAAASMIGHRRSRLSGHRCGERPGTGVDVPSVRPTMPSRRASGPRRPRRPVRHAPGATPSAQAARRVGSSCS